MVWTLGFRHCCMPSTFLGFPVGSHWLHCTVYEEGNHWFHWTSPIHLYTSVSVDICLTTHLLFPGIFLVACSCKKKSLFTDFFNPTRAHVLICLMHAVDSINEISFLFVILYFETIWNYCFSCREKFQVLFIIALMAGKSVERASGLSDWVQHMGAEWCRSFQT